MKQAFVLHWRQGQNSGFSFIRWRKINSFLYTSWLCFRLFVKKCATHLDSDGQRASPIASCIPCFSEGASSFPNVFCGPMSQVWTKSKRFVTLPIWRVRLTVLRKSFVCPCQCLDCGKLLPHGGGQRVPPLLQSHVPSLCIYPFPTHCPILRCEVKRWPPPSG